MSLRLNELFATFLLAMGRAPVDDNAQILFIFDAYGCGKLYLRQTFFARGSRLSFT
ncbi:MAG: hypothetical protein WC689_00600 [Methylocystis sp.]|jgi:hypothetical protein